MPVLAAIWPSDLPWPLSRRAYSIFSSGWATGRPICRPAAWVTGPGMGGTLGSESAFHLRAAILVWSGHCAASVSCSWSHTGPMNWRTNRIPAAEVPVVRRADGALVRVPAPCVGGVPVPADLRPQVAMCLVPGGDAAPGDCD